MVAMAIPRSAAEDALHRLTRRCVECPSIQPSCPNCADDETCSLLPGSCTSCASTTCVKITSLPGQTQAKNESTPIGPIIGGVVAGVVVIFVLIYLFWRFCIRSNRRKDTWVPPEKTGGRSAALQSRTNSIASTVLTRASNVIQIAYIPGVTVRSAPETPEIHPPMPTVPSTYAGTSANTTPELEQHFFMPSRDSTWSDATSIAPENRISLTPSLARASVATTIYRNDAVVPPIPAQYAYQTQANVVNVRSGSSTPNSQNNGIIPPLPQAPQQQSIQAINGSQVVARNVTARPVEIKKIGGPSNNVPTVANLAKRSSQTRAKTNFHVFSDEKEVVVSPASASDLSLLSSNRGPRAYASIESASALSALGANAVTPADGPLGSSSTASQRQTDPADEISAMIQNAIKSATSDLAHGNQRPELQARDSGPFSDANEINENRSNLI